MGRHCFLYMVLSASPSVAVCHEYLHHVLPVHEYVGDGAVVDILAMGHDADRSFTQ